MRERLQAVQDRFPGATELVAAVWGRMREEPLVGVLCSVALAATPIAFGPEHVDRLRRSGLDDLAIADVIHAAAFFNWANRLMLSLGEPSAAAQTQG